MCMLLNKEIKFKLMVLSIQVKSRNFSGSVYYIKRTLFFAVDCPKITVNDSKNK